MSIQWDVFVRIRDHSTGSDEIQLANCRRPIEGATPADFGLSLAEARQILAKLQHVVKQSQVHAYDRAHRRCQWCGKYRRIKDWRARVFSSCLGEVRVRIPRVHCCMCTDEPLDEDGIPTDLREFTCPIARQLPGRLTPELAYLCAKHGATSSYRTAAAIVREIAGLSTLSHMRVRRHTIAVGEAIEDSQFHTGWFAGGRKRHGADYLQIAIDGTVVSAAPSERVTKFEVVAGRVERDGHMGRRFACALPRRTLTSILLRAALEECGWVRRTLVDVVNDGDRGMRSLVTDVVPSVATPVLDWFHIGMKLRAIQTPLTSGCLFMFGRPSPMKRFEVMWRQIREALWRGHGEDAVERSKALIKAIRTAVALHKLPPFFELQAITAEGAATRLLKFLDKNGDLLINYNRARHQGRRIST